MIAGENVLGLDHIRAARAADGAYAVIYLPTGQPATVKLDKRTLVLFTSDNGGAGGMSMGPLRGGKGSPKYEGHMREPTLAWWPGSIPNWWKNSEPCWTSTRRGS